MPNYNYRCTKCENFFEVFQNMSDDKFNNCSQLLENKCNDDGLLIRIITGGSGMIFKGSGFYLTDYSNKKNEIKKDENNE